MIPLHISEDWVSRFYEAKKYSILERRNEIYQLTKLSVDITSIMYFSLKNNKRASTGMDKGLNFNLITFDLMNDNHTIRRNLKIRSLDRSSNHSTHFRYIFLENSYLLALSNSHVNCPSSGDDM